MITNTMLGDKYIFDVPVYDILANPTYSHSFEFYAEKFKVNKFYKHDYSLSPIENLIHS